MASQALKQVRTLIGKDLRILILRHFTSTLYTAILLPVLLTIYVGIGQNLANAGNEYGIAELRPVRTLEDALRASDPSRSNVVFVDNGNTNAEIDSLIGALEERVKATGKTVHRFSDIESMGRVCAVSFQGTTPCYGGVVFNAAPGSGWNYTMRGDANLGGRFRFDKDDNDPQIYVLPLQRAIDQEIARLEGSEPSFEMQELLFTNQTETQRKDRARQQYQNAYVRYMSVAILTAFMGAAYHLAGYLATEREKGISALIDAMMSSTQPWQPQVVRMVSYFSSFSITYLPGWIMGSLILKFMLWKHTSIGVVLPYFILACFALISQALMGGTFFRKAQLSGVVNGIIYILLGVLVQAVDVSTAGAAILGLAFTPCNIVLMLKYLARAEAAGQAADLLHVPEHSDHALPAVVLWVFLIVQTCVCPFIAAGLERLIHRAAADSRVLWSGNGPDRPQFAVAVEALTKIYRPSFLRRALGVFWEHRKTVTAVQNLDLIIPRGQIVSLLGANGSGKSTTLDAMAGIQGFSKGKVVVDASGGIGIAPQKNVMWDELTTIEHIRIFNELKCPARPATDQELQDLINGVGLSAKKDTRSDALSGGQRRKLQLAMMLTGGSSVCCIDEVSSGLDTLSRQNIWDLLLAERGKRTIILTTHFLDEAEQLSDTVAIMSKGVLCVQGSVVDLKARFGSGYRIHLAKRSGRIQPPDVEGSNLVTASDSVSYEVSSSHAAASVIRVLEAADLSYSISNPSLEDVFLKCAEEYKEVAVKHNLKGMGDTLVAVEDHTLQSGRHISILQQTAVLMRKRLKLLRNNWLPYLIAFLLPIIAASVMQLVVANEKLSTCTPIRLEGGTDLKMYNDAFDNATVLVGPESSSTGLEEYLDLVNQSASQELLLNLDSISAMVETNRGRIKPGGYWESDSPVVIYRADEDFMASAVIAQNLLDVSHTGVNIITSYLPFDSTFGSAGKTLQLAIYFAVALGIASSFLSLYPNLERRSHVRGLQYSTGVRVLSLWTSHIAFDFLIMLVPVIVSALIFNFSSNAFWYPAYLVPVFILFSIVSTLLGYIISCIMGSQLSTWAATTAYNGVGLAVYLISFLFIINLSDATRAQTNIEIAHYVVALIFPVGSLIRAMLVGLNVFSQACNGPDFIGYAGALKAFGAPILYLSIQAVFYFCILLSIDSKTRIVGTFAKKSTDQERASDTTGVQVQGLTKKFDDLVAVDDVSFNVERSEVFALLGPNGAGKSTLISMIRGDLAATKGDAFVEQISVTQNRALARSNLGVCPQYDAIDAMTTEQHLEHYARLRGIKDIARQIDTILQAVGLEDFRDTMAANLSGGNKRKLSLGMALTGNPSVILLDEPSSGLDAAAKRIMWSTLQSVMPSRSILLTTHSMEEAGILAQRAGILAKQMLAMGTVDNLRRAFGDTLHVHMVSRTAPHSSVEDMQAMRAVVFQLFPDAEVQEKTFHGQLRFSVPAAAVRTTTKGTESSMGQLLLWLEENKDRLQVDHYSISPTTLNDVFLAIVGEHQVQEEGYQPSDQAAQPKAKAWRKLLLGF